MKVLCTESCFNSNELLRFDSGKVYEIDSKTLQTILGSDMGRYFTDEKGEVLESRTAKPPKKEGK